MKIGTLTYHRAVNYGAVLQTYALQKVLDKLGIENEVIDYRSDFIEWVYKPFCMRKVKNLWDFVKVIEGAPIKSRKMKQFFDFTEKNIRLSKEKYTKENISNANDIYDLFISGSDQVFNFKCSNNDKNYFLDFVTDNKKKNSYAASFGFDKIPDEHVEEYKRLLSTFNNISVREEQGVKIVKDAVQKEATEVLDPTLLLSGDEWKEIIKTPKIHDKGYILVYAMKPSDMLIHFADKLEKMTGLEILFIKDALTREGHNVLKENIRYVKHVDPAEFVELFSKAEYVITNSFHGTAFSINFNKKFFTELLAPETKVNSRLENILDMLDLRSRQILSLDNVTLDEIDYERVNNILEERKKISIDYLTKNILANLVNIC